MTMKNNSSKLQLFQSRIKSFLAEPYPGEPGRFFLHVHLGGRNVEAVSELRKALPGNVFILYVSESCFDKEPNEKRMLFSDIVSGLLPVKVSILAGILRIDDGHRISMSCEKGMEGLFEKVLPFIKNSATEAVSNIKCEKRARLIQIRCSIQNIPLIFSDRSRLLGKVSPETSALICGAGPSLSGQLEMIKKHSGRFILICVGRLAKTLSQNGLMPDFVVEMDPECYLNWEHSEKMNCPLAAFPIISPEVAERFPEIVWFAEPSSPFTEFMKKKNIELPSLSLSRGVIVSAIDLALKLGCKKIALAGNDLCFSSAGKAYAEESQEGSKESLFEIPASDGGKVLTNWVFNGVREVLERNIAVFKENNKGLKIYNCTPSGAHIENTEPMLLEKFIEISEIVDKMNLLNRSRVAFISPGFKDAEKDVLEYAGIAEKITEICIEIQNALEIKDLSEAEVLKEGLKNAFDSESRLAKTSFAEPLLSVLKEYSEDISKDRPEPRAAKEDLRSQVLELQEKYSLIHDLCMELHDDFRESGKKKAYIFQSFRNFALSFIKRNNEEFADFLNGLSCDSSGFQMRANQQYLPTSVKKRMDGGKFLELVDGGLEMEEKARAKIVEFIKDKNFLPEKCAAVFFAPGNWAHVVEFANIFTDADIMVVEPWPELLSALISSCMFMQSLPRKTTVVGIDEKLGKWKRIYHSQMRKWLRAGKEIVFFEHPVTWKLEEVKDLLKELPS